MAKKTKRSEKAPAGWNFAAMLVAILVCAVLGIAAYSKIVDPNKAKFITLGGSEFQYERWIGIFEVLVIVALLAGHRLRMAWLGVLALFAMFSGYAAYYLATGESCGCFGNALDNTPLEWMTAKGVSLAFDIVFVLAALGLLALRGFGAASLVGLLAGSILLSGVGAGLGSVEHANYKRTLEEARERIAGQTDEREELKPGLRVAKAPAILVRHESFADLLSDSIENPDRMWYIFVYDPDCSECMQMKPLVEMFEQQYADEQSPFMQVRQITKQEIQRTTGLDFWTWETGATTILVQDGDILKVYDAKLTPSEKPLPDEVLEEFFEKGAIEGNWPPVRE
jgi:hypothetical protein